MKSIESKQLSLLEINKSKFYCILYYLESIEEVDKILDSIKLEYKDATHYCYAYIFDQIKRFNDDGEPGGTAGMPILNVLENNDLNHILAVVVRYFGGIKLGAGGLVRAYTNSVSETLKLCDIVNLVNGKKIKIQFSYDNLKQVDYLLKEFNIINKKYENNVTYAIDVPVKIDLKSILGNHIISYETIDNILIKQKQG